MCGIAGWADWERNLTRECAAIEAMTRSLRHRGPDGHGVWLSARAALGHRRLAVIDLEGGSQPMVKERPQGRIVIVYNGELYNTAELRRTLIQRGHAFTTRSDTEALLTAYLEWGESCVHHLDGIFAFAIWDERIHRLFIARDRLGVKPLFYVERGRTLWFASELKALLAHPAIEPEVDAEGLAEVLVMGPGRTPGHGVFRSVRELPPGSRLTFDRRGMRISPYWRLTSRPHRDGPEETAERVRSLLSDAVRRQLVSDVPICAFLSGGLDSSAIAALAAGALDEPLATFSLEYAGNEEHFRPNSYQPDQDRPWIRRVSAALKTRHREILISPEELLEATLRAMEARDLPGMADIDGSLLLFCQAVRQEATVALSGESADEIFGGYPWFHQEQTGETFPWHQQLNERMRLLSPEVRDHLQPEAYARRRYEEAVAETPLLPTESADGARMRRLFHLNLTRWLAGLLERKDRMSMAVGLEVRVPYCDHRLVEYAWNIPWDMKRLGGQPKGILRKALEGVLPPEILQRPKSPFPRTYNPEYAEAVRKALEEALADPASPLLPLVNAEALRAVARNSSAFHEPWFGQLMRRPQLLAYFVQVDAWLRRYKVRVV